MSQDMMPGARPRVGISRCLLGAPVRYDGGHKLEPGIVGAIGRDVEFVDVCPEVEVGMGVPREPIQLVAPEGPGPLRLIGVRSGRDWTESMTAWSEVRIRDLAAMHLSGYILKARSPSCGLQNVPVYASDAAGIVARDRGRFADALLLAMPDLPVEDEEGLRDPDALRTFLERIRAFHQRSRPGSS